MLTHFCEQMLAAIPDRRAETEAWVAALEAQLTGLGSVSLDTLDGPTAPPPRLSGHRPFKLAEVPARDARFHPCRFYWPDIIDPSFPYGEGIRLQLRSAVSHLNEIWALEAAGEILHAFAGHLGWEFVFDAARKAMDNCLT